MACAEITVLEALAARLGDIRTSNAFETDIGTKVYETEPEPEEAPNGPFVVIGGIAVELIEEAANDWLMNVELAAYIDGQDSDYSSARNTALDALRDIDRALRGNADWGATVMHVRVQSKALPRRIPGSRYLVATAAIEIDYYDED